jgi:hypothetical protein
MFLRGEISKVDDGSTVATLAGINKEFRAAKEAVPSGAINYSSLFSRFSQYPWTIHAPITPEWTTRAQVFARNLKQKLCRYRKPLYPAFQRNKNMSRESAMLLNQDGYRYVDKHWTDLSTGDLESHYAKTGRKVGGGCEMRMAWKYNELKPRCYYCLGGVCYWEARFMKPIAIDFMNSNPITHVTRRMDPTEISRFLDPDDWICLWDLESFTTRLSELRQFLYYTARYLERDLQVRQHPIPVLDAYQGVVDLNIWEMLDRYNLVVNENSEFTMFRLIEKFGLDWDVDEFQQENSGMLGVPGNIGLSTALHGVHILPLIDADKGVGVGDDEMTADHEDPEERLIPHIQVLGKIQREKFEVIPPLDHGTYVTSKFVKRPLTRTRDDLYLGKMFNFPMLAYPFDVKNPDRTVSFTAQEGVDLFVKSVGSLYWEIQAYSQHVGEEDLLLIRRIFRLAYQRFRFPFTGALPGFRSETVDLSTLCIPPIDDEFDPRYEDWSEVLWTRRSERFVLLPVETNNSRIPDFVPYMRFQCAATRLTTYLEVLGVVVKERKLKQWVEVNEDNRRLFRLQMQGLVSSLVQFQFQDFDPPWLSDLMNRIYIVSTAHMFGTWGVYGQGNKIGNAINLF